ncbi:hypothetical protein ACGF5C_25260 [Micromonospora sp. NPDC047620]|uniref:hypothetical protein n=1 Tax=Micromonospora sp. NPDC047620 TaxID=3364251 RepID=UPI00371BC615
MRRRSKVRLSVGAGAARKVRAFGFSLPFVVVGGFLLWVPFDLIFESLTESPINVWGSLLPHLFVSAWCFLGVYIVGAVSLAMVAVISHGAWLDGTLLGERLWLRTRWVDLSTANIDTEDDPRRGVMSLLVAAPNPEIQVKLPVRGVNSLPPEELVALADAITGTRVRQGPDDAAFVIADRLRSLAS